jgi:segregation and condensation protein B
VAGVLETLIDRKLIRIAGRKESMGRPLLYGTTQDFLRAFGLRRLEDLPSIESLVPAELPTKDEADAKATQNELPLDTAETEISIEEIPVSVEPVENSTNQN